MSEPRREGQFELGLALQISEALSGSCLGGAFHDSVTAIYPQILMRDADQAKMQTAGVLVISSIFNAKQHRHAYFTSYLAS